MASPILASASQSLHDRAAQVAAEVFPPMTMHREMATTLLREFEAIIAGQEAPGYSEEQRSNIRQAATSPLLKSFDEASAIAEAFVDINHDLSDTFFRDISDISWDLMNSQIANIIRWKYPYVRYADADEDIEYSRRMSEYRRQIREIYDHWRKVWPPPVPAIIRKIANSVDYPRPEFNLLRSSIQIDSFFDLARIRYFYLERGYEQQSYFVFVNPQDPRVQAQKYNGLPLAPTTFEQGGSLLSLEQYRAILADIHANMDDPYFNSMPSVYANPASGMLSWSEFALRKALRESGLLTRIVSYRRNSGSQDALPYSTLGYDFITDVPKALPGTRKSHWHLSGFPKPYYQTIYRKVFNTLATVNWLAVIDAKVPTMHELRFVAVNDFQMGDSDFQDGATLTTASRQQLCTAIESKAEPRRRAMWQLADSGSPLSIHADVT